MILKCNLQIQEKCKLHIPNADSICFCSTFISKLWDPCPIYRLHSKKEVETYLLNTVFQMRKSILQTQSQTTHQDGTHTMNSNNGLNEWNLVLKIHICEFHIVQILGYMFISFNNRTSLINVPFLIGWYRKDYHEATATLSNKDGNDKHKFHSFSTRLPPHQQLDPTRSSKAHTYFPLQVYF